MKLEYRGELRTEYHPQLDSLFFFNQRQAGYCDNIRMTIERFGCPRIGRRGDSVFLTLDGEFAVQNLFAVEQSHPCNPLLGAAIYTRFPLDTLAVLHLAVSSECCDNSRLIVCSGLLRELRGIARKVKGIQRIKVDYLGFTSAN